MFFRFEGLLYSSLVRSIPFSYWSGSCVGKAPVSFVCCAEGISIRYALFGWIGQGTSIKDLSTHSSYYKSKSRHGGGLGIRTSRWCYEMVISRIEENRSADLLIAIFLSSSGYGIAREEKSFLYR